jgi:hypothetical protein
MNEARYPMPTYEWSRIALFVALCLFVLGLRAAWPPYGVLGEVMKSIFLAVLATLLLLTLLSGSERGLIAPRLRFKLWTVL